MKAHLSEIHDGNGQVAVAVIWVRAASTNMSWTKLGAYIEKYVGHRGHNLYVHTQEDTVAAIISFTLEQYPGDEIEI